MNVFRWTATIAVLAASTATAQVQNAPEAGQRVFVTRIVNTGKDAIIVGEHAEGGLLTGPGVLAFTSGGPDLDVFVEASPHWIGLGCGAATEALRAQLGLTDVGVVVFNVVDNSPAAAAGFQPHDVLIKARIGDKELALRDTQDVIQAVKDSQRQSFQVEIVRAGKSQTLTVTPADRPQVQPAAANQLNMVVGEGGVLIDPEHVRQLLSEKKFDELQSYITQRSQMVPESVRYRVTGPVVTTYRPAPVAQMSHDLPENMTITITKSGNHPTQIKVEKGDDWWKAAETELSSFPNDIRGHVQSTLRQLMLQMAKTWTATDQLVRPYGLAPGTPFPPGISAPIAPAVPVPHWPVPVTTVAPTHNYQQQLEHQQKQLDAVLKQIEDLKQSLEKLQPRN